MNDIPTPPMDAYPVPSPTLMETLHQKLHEAHEMATVAESRVKELEAEIASIPKHMHDMTASALVMRINGWFS
jgi:hypothetical protein